MKNTCFPFKIVDFPIVNRRKKHVFSSKIVDFPIVNRREKHGFSSKVVICIYNGTVISWCMVCNDTVCIIVLTVLCSFSACCYLSYRSSSECDIACATECVPHILVCSSASETSSNWKST